MTFRIPSEDRRLAQPNSSDVVGNLYATRNIDLDEQGYIKLSDGAVSIYGEDDDADADNLSVFFHGTTAVNFFGSDLFRDNLDFSSTPTNITATHTTPPSPGVEEDGIGFNGTEVVSDGTQLYYRSASTTWTTFASPTLTSTVPTCLEVHQAQNSLLVGNGNKVYRYNTSWALAQTLTLPTDFRVMSIAVNGNYAYIATRHVSNGEAMVFLWNGVNTTNDGSFGVDTFGINSIKKYGSSVALVDSLGRLLQFNGSGFTMLGALPVYYSRGDWSDANNDYGGLDNRGMVVDGDLIYLNVDADIEMFESTQLPNMPGGIWCYDPRVGLYHKWSPTNSVIVKDTAVDEADINTTTNVITVSGITVPITGSLVFYVNGGTSIGGLTTNTFYYVIKVTDTTLKLAGTYQNAIGGTAIDLTSATASNDFYFIVQKDFGIVEPLSRNAVLVLNNTEYNRRQMRRIVFASNALNTTGTQKSRLNVLCPLLPTRGYFITPKMFATEHLDMFNSINLRFRPLKYGDEIRIKYRVEERTALPSSTKESYTGTWTSSTVFTTTASPSATNIDLSTVAIGDEVEILSGSGSGHIAHVTAISQSGFQWTVTIDESTPFVTASDTMTFIINNWKFLETIDYTYGGTSKTLSVDTSSSWCQFKVELRGTAVAIEDSVVTNRPFSSARASVT